MLPQEGAHLPGWWTDSLNWLIGINPHPGKKYPLLGSNIAFRRQVLKKINFNPQHPVATAAEFLPYSEDNYRLATALRHGFSLTIEPSMVVYHRVPAVRCCFSRLVRRAFDEGRALASWQARCPLFLRALLHIPLNVIALVFTADPDRFFRTVMHSGYALSFCYFKLLRLIRR